MKGGPAGLRGFAQAELDCKESLRLTGEVVYTATAWTNPVAARTLVWVGAGDRAWGLPGTPTWVLGLCLWWEEGALTHGVPSHSHPSLPPSRDEEAGLWLRAEPLSGPQRFVPMGICS